MGRPHGAKAVRGSSPELSQRGTWRQTRAEPLKVIHIRFLCGLHFLTSSVSIEHMTESNLYRILQVDPNADHDVVDAAYRRLAHKYHPDKSGPEASEEHMRQLNHAYEVISDPDKRCEYDRQVAVQEERATGESNRRHQASSDARSSESALQAAVRRVPSRRRVTVGGGYGRVSSLAELEGAVIRAHDGTYLGLISSDSLKQDSICNRYGSHGSPYSASSIETSTEHMVANTAQEARSTSIRQHRPCS